MKQKTGKYLIITSEEFSDNTLGPCILYVANPYMHEDYMPVGTGMVQGQEYDESDYFIYPENSPLIFSIDNIAQSNKPWAPNMAEFVEGRMNYGGRGFIRVFRHISLLRRTPTPSDTHVNESSSNNLCNIGDTCYEKQDYLQAFKYYTQAAQMGNVHALTRLGHCYEMGLGVEKDMSKAIKAYREAAEQDDAEGLFNLGYCYLLGKGIEANSNVALRYIHKAADLGNTDAMCCLGQCHCEGMLGWSTGIREDFVEAVKWFKKAAEGDHPKAMYLLGSAYKFGHGVSVDYEKAAYWFEEAAELGNHDTMYSLANCYRKGDGVPTDITEAAYWYEKAAELGNRDAMFNIAVCYYKGQGVSRNKEKSREWFEKAYRCGDLKALKMLREYF